MPIAEIAGAFASGFSDVFAPNTLGLMLVGIALGFAVGILPGLGGPTTLALMLPFIFTMQPVEAFAFLLGMAAVTATTGDITSILFGVPGEPTTASTIVDGHPMAKKGEAGRALGAALASSLVGAIFGAFALALAIPIVRPLVLTFGSPELFMLAVLGMTFVASLSGENLLKGLIAGGIGLLFATVGLDPMTATQRYTFDQLFLWDGIGLVPITIGFFAIPEIIDLAVQRSAIARASVEKLGGVMQGVKDTFRHFWLVVRCSALGAYVGIIPGMGGGVSQWLAYAHAVQSSPRQERFGKGAVEGVLGPGAANNSTLGGNLIPTIAFGVPGGVMTAILLGAFTIQGLVPGPSMLTPESQGGHLSLTFSFVWMIVISNLVTVAVCFVFLRQLAKVTMIRGSLLIPPILLLIYVGAFAEKNAFPDLLLVLLFGVLGWLMEKFHWPRPPLILGVVLGPLAENRLFLATDNYGLAWLGRPGVLILIALTLAGAFYPMLKRAMQRRENRSAGSQRAATKIKRPAFDRGMLFTLAIVVVVGAALWQSRNFGFRPGLFPWAVGIPLFVLAVAQLFVEVTRGVERPPKSPAEHGEEIPDSIVARRTAVMFGWIFGYLVAIWLLGFTIGGVLCTFLSLKVGSREPWPISLALTAAMGAFVYGVFELALHVPFPPGALFDWVGLTPS
ncbi:MAG: tripartite tricarboxylate transporter permease [Betaproteobacteria bacterium]|nr:tripartite tricarboxylate transporter permease [Betaproteobacteria bacterium]